MPATGSGWVGVVRRDDERGRPRVAEQTARIAFPVWCVYRGGHRALGAQGRNLWIADGRIGTGLDGLRHAVPLTEVDRVGISDRRVNDGRPGMAQFVADPPRSSFGGTEVRQLTDVVVRTVDGQEARWLVHHRDAAWVRARLAPALRAAGVALH